MSCQPWTKDEPQTFKAEQLEGAWEWGEVLNRG